MTIEEFKKKYAERGLLEALVKLSERVVVVSDGDMVRYLADGQRLSPGFVKEVKEMLTDLKKLMK